MSVFYLRLRRAWPEGGSGPGYFLLLAHRESNQREGRPGSPPLPRKLVAVPCAARQSGAAAELTDGFLSPYGVLDGS